jgi:hypothetical protein
MSVKNVAPLWVEKPRYYRQGAIRPIFGDLKADQYYYKFLAASYKAASLSIVS